MGLTGEHDGILVASLNLAAHRWQYVEQFTARSLTLSTAGPPAVAISSALLSHGLLARDLACLSVSFECVCVRACVCLQMRACVCASHLQSLVLLLSVRHEVECKLRVPEAS